MTLEPDSYEMNEDLRDPEQAASTEELHDSVDSLAPADAFDSVIEALKAGIDRTQLRRNLELTPEERVQKFLSFARLANELREAGRRARELDPEWGLK